MTCFGKKHNTQRRQADENLSESGFCCMDLTAGAALCAAAADDRGRKRKNVLLYVPMDGGNAGGSVGVYLLEELESVYGDAENPKRTEGIWQGKTVVIEDSAEYTLEYKGKEVWDTGEYLECTIVIWRDIKDPVTGKELASGVSLSSVLGYDDGDLNSAEPAHILWGTLQDTEFHGSGFDAEPVS